MAKEPSRPRTAKATVMSAKEKDAADALAVPAFYANTTHAMSAPGVIRLAFGESAPKSTTYSSAFVMSYALARDLRDTLEKLLEQAGEAEADPEDDDAD